MNYVDRVTGYAKDVISGKIPACVYVINACKRHLDDLKRQNTEDFPYVFNPVLVDSDGREYQPVDRVCFFIEQLPHVKGKWARDRLKLELQDWQVFIEGSIFGWIHVETGLRRFKTAYIEVPRKNAKTTLCSGNGLFLLTRDDEVGAEVYSAATTSDQARISWSIAHQMVDKSPGMQLRFGVKNYAHSIAIESEGSFFQYLSSDSKGLDGLNISGAIVDELHAHKTRDVWDVIDTGTGSREQPLLFIITTAGSNRAGICYEQRAYVIKILDKVVPDETFFGIIYTIDENDDWTDPNVWQKANPNYGVSVSPDDLKRKAQKAMTMASAQNNFMTKHLNVWVNADTAWMSMVKWDKCADESIEIDDFSAYPAMIGIDLSSKIDIASMAILFEVEKDEKYALFVKNYLPEDAIQESGNAMYDGWVTEGRIIETDGNTVDYGRIEDDLLELCETYNVKQIGYDPFQATQFSQRMIDQGLEMIEVRPTVLNFSEPMKKLEEIVYKGNLQHSGCPALSWMVSNVVCHVDAKDNIYPRKEFRENKIDAVIASIMCLHLFIKYEEQKPSVYETRGVIRL